MPESASTSPHGLRESVQQLIPELWDTLADLVKCKSVSVDQSSPLAATAKKVAGLFRAAGVPSAAVQTIRCGDATSAPMVYAAEKGPPGAPTVLLYAHYDVQPADASKWKVVSDPFVPKEVREETDVRLYGRGAADNKSGIVMHLGAIRALRAVSPALPVGLKLVIEGEEETGRSVLDTYLVHNPDDARFHADVIVIADTGNVRVGAPTLTTTLRGIVVVDVELRTLRQAVHSGMYGGPAPDAFMALGQMLASLLDRQTGDVAIPGLCEHKGPWAEFTPESFRTDAGVLSGVRLIGTESVQKRLYGKPSINVVGLSGVPSMAQPTNVLCPRVKARISVRLAPNQDPDDAYTAVCRHLRRVAPWDIEPTITKVGAGWGFIAAKGTYGAVIEQALRNAYQVSEVNYAGQGGSIPLVSAFHTVNRHSDVVLWGCEEPKANIHSPDESISRSELEHMTLAEADLIGAVGGASIN